MKTSFEGKISHNQIIVRSKPYDSLLEEWGEGNINQGIVWHPGYIAFDPLVDGAFDAMFFIDTDDSTFDIDQYAQRAVEVPFYIFDDRSVCIGTVFHLYFLFPPLEKTDVEDEKRYGKFYPLGKELVFRKDAKYRLLFQVCVGPLNQNAEDKNEVYYKFSFKEDDTNQDIIVRIDDEYGLSTSTEILEGKV